MRTLSHPKIFTVPGDSALLILHKQSNNGDGDCVSNTYCDQFYDAAEDIDDGVNIIFQNPLKNLKTVTRTTLTGNDNRFQQQNDVAPVQPVPSYEEQQNGDNSDNDDLPLPQPSAVSSTTNGRTMSKAKDTLLKIDLEPMALEAFKVDF